MKTLIEMRQDRAKLVKDAREVLEKAQREDRKLTAEEGQQYDQMFTDIETSGHDIERFERQQELDRQLAADASGANALAGDGSGARSEKGNEEAQAKAAAQVRAAFRRYLIGGPSALSADEVRMLAATERRDAQADADTLGGYMVAPQQFVNDLIKFIDDEVIVRRLATKYQIGAAQSLGVPSLDTDPADADWTTELGTGTADTAMAFGKREFRPHPIAKRIKVSNKLIRTSAMDIEQLIRARLGYKFGITHEKAFMTGSGAAQPLGLFTASALGISTARDVSTGNTTTTIQADGLIETKFKLKKQYHARSQWIFHRDGVKQIMKLKDGEGRFMYQPSLTEQTPDMLLGRPLNWSEYAPNTFTTGLYVGILGDFSFYWIVDATDMVVQRLVELYAETNQVGFIGRLESDGMPVLEEAFARVKLA